MKKITALVIMFCILAAIGLTSCQKASTDTTYKILDEAFADEYFTVGFRKADLALCEEVNRILSEMKADGKLGKISTEWFGSDATTVPASYAVKDTTDDSLQKIKTKGKFILGLDDSFPPMGFKNNDGQIVGFDVDVAREVCRRMGVELVLQPVKWTEKESEINNGNVDCLWNGFTRNDEREAALCLSQNYMTNRQVVVVMESSDIKTPADLAGKTLIIQGGSTAADALEDHQEIKKSLKGGKALEVDNNVLAMFDMKNGGSDAVLMDEVVARYYIKTGEIPSK